MNYWAPLHDEEDEINKPEQINIIAGQQPLANTKSNTWMCRIERRRAMKLVINSGATSNFVPEEMNLPREGKSSKEV